MGAALCTAPQLLICLSAEHQSDLLPGGLDGMGSCLHQLINSLGAGMISFFCICEADSINGVPSPDLTSRLDSAMTTCKALNLGDWTGMAKVRGCFLTVSGG